MKQLLPLIILLAGLSPLSAASLDRSLRTDGKIVLEALNDVADIAKKCTVQIYNGARFVGLGTVISEDGLIVAKNSEYSTVREGKVRVTGSGLGPRILSARVVARDIPHDLVILDIDRDTEPGFEWAESKEAAHGTWVVAGVMGSTRASPVRCGVLSANQRTIKKAGGVIGVILGGKDGEEFGGVEVTEVAKDGPAFKAGVKKGDVIFAIDDEEVFVRQKMIDKVKSHDPGTAIKVSLKRGGKEMELEITLGYRNIVYADMKSRNDRMSGKVSVRRTGFQSALQHEISLGPSDMGGPLFDLEGRLVGINIAKANRVEFYAIPADAIRQVLEEKADEIAVARGEK